MTKVSSSIPLVPAEENGKTSKVSGPLLQDYVKSFNGGSGNGSLGAFDRLMAGTVSVKHRTGEEPKTRYDHLYGVIR